MIWVRRSLLFLAGVAVGGFLVWWYPWLYEDSEPMYGQQAGA